MNWKQLSRIMTRNLKKARSATATHPPLRSSLSVLSLEDRVTPAVFTVINALDFGAGSLRDAIAQANSSTGVDTILFDPLVFATPQTISMTKGQLTITDSLTITGPGSGFLAIRSAVSAPSDTNRIFNINSPTISAIDVNISGMVLSGGNVSGASSSGGAILLDQDNLTLSDVTITGNQATGDGGAIQVASAKAKLVLQNSSLTKNSATGNGGAINVGNAVGTDFSTVTVINTTLDTNTAKLGGAINFTNNGELKVIASTISGNTATGSGITTKNLSAAGGGINFYGSPQGSGFVISNSTLSANKATVGSGGAIAISNLGGINPIIQSSTITGNTAGISGNPGGGGLVVITQLTSGNLVNVTSSIIAANTNTQNPDISVPGNVINISNSLIGTADKLNISGSKNKTGTTPAPLDPLLRPLGNYGGPTLTHRPLPGSPVIDAGSLPLGVTSDQRGAPYVRSSGVAPDIGSFELQPLDPPFVTGASLTNVGNPGGTVYKFSLTFTAEGGGSLLDTSTMIGNNNAVIVTGPNFFTAPAKFISIDNGSPGTPRLLTLSITPPGGAWDVSDNGTYTIQLLPNQIGSTLGTFAPGGPVGTFTVSILPTFTVSNDNDSGTGSLRQAIVDANKSPGKNTIFFDPSFFNQPRTINLSSGFITISESVSIIGPGSSQLTVSGTPTFATPINRIFRLFDNFNSNVQDVLISGMTLTGGNLNQGFGGAISQVGEILTLDDVIVTRNSSSEGSGGIDVDKGGTLNLLNSRVTRNNSTGTGFSGGGIGVFTNSNLTVVNSTIDKNSTVTSGGGIYIEGGNLSIANSTISNNSAANGIGGGVAIVGTNTAKISNTTISGNSATNVAGGGVGITFQLNPVVIQNSTIVNNNAGTPGGGGIYSPNKFPFVPSAFDLQLTSSIVSKNTSIAAPGTINPEIVLEPTLNPTSKVTAVNNIIGAFDNINFSPDLFTAKANNNIGAVGAIRDPLLGPLQNNGGANFTHAPLAGSPAINNGSNPGALTTDQRGTNFLRSSGKATDVGAFEVQSPALVSITVPTGGPTNTASFNATVTFNQPISNLSASNFQLVTTKAPLAVNQASGTIGTPTGGPLVWTVPISGIAGTGTLQLNFANNAGISPTTSTTSLIGPVVAVDREAPSIVSITPLLANPATSSTLTFQVVFSEPATGLNTNNFSLATTGSVQGTIATVVGTPTTYTVTVTNVIGDGTLGLNMVNTNSVTDPAGNPVSNTPFTGGLYQIGRPIVLSISSQQGNFTSSSNITFDLTFSQPVNGVNIGTNLTALFTNMPPVVPTLTPVGALPTAKYTVAFAGLAPLAPNGSVQLVVNAAGIVPAPALTPFNSTPVVVDIVPPQVSTITLPDPTLTNLSTVRFVLTLTEPVTGLTANNLQLTGSLVGATIGTIVSNGNGSEYTVSVTTPANRTGTLGLSVSNATGLTDLAGNVLANPGFTSPLQYTIDRIAPSVVGIVRTGPTPTSQAQVQFFVTFTKPVNGVTISRFSLSSSVGGSSIVGLSGSGTDYFVTVNTGVGDGTIGLNLVNPTGIIDNAGNTVSSTFAGQVYEVLKIPPRVESINRLDPSPTGINSVRYEVRFTKPVFGVDSGDFNLVVSGLTAAGITSVTGSGTTYTVTATTGSGNGAIRLDLVDNDTILDLAGNPLGGPGFNNGNFFGQTYNIDRLAPTASVSIAPQQAIPALAGPVLFLVQFSEPVVGFASNSLAITGSAGSNGVTITGSGDTYVVTVDTTGRSGTLTLAVNPGITTDQAGNVTSGSVNSATITVNAPPVPIRPPVTAPNTYSAFAGLTLNIPAPGVLGNDFDPQGRSMTVQLVNGPAANAGQLTLNNDGSFRFVPRPGYLGAASFTYTASNGTAVSAPTTVTINVGPKQALLAVGAGPGGGPRVRVLNANDGSPRFDFFAYSLSFTGGVNVATGDVNGDGIDDIITAVAGNGAPHIKVFNGLDGTLLNQFFAYATTFTGGVFVAAGDVNADSRADVIVGAGIGGGPHVQVFDALSTELLRNFFAYDENFRGGVNVAAGDVNGDGISDIVTGAGPGGGPHIRVYNGLNLSLLQNFIIPDFPQAKGVNVSVGDINGDGKGDVIAGAGQGSQVRIYDGNTGQLLQALQADDTPLSGGVRVTTKDLSGDNVPDVLFLAPGPGSQTFVRRLRLPSLVQLEDFNAFEPGFVGGVFVG